MLDVSSSHAWARFTEDLSSYNSDLMKTMARGLHHSLRHMLPKADTQNTLPENKKNQVKYSHSVPPVKAIGNYSFVKSCKYEGLISVSP